MRRDKAADRAYKNAWKRADRAKNPEKYRAKARDAYRNNETVREKAKAATTEWRRNNPEVSAASIAAWKRTPAYKRHLRAQNLKRYGLTLESFDALLRTQGGACAICRQQFETKPRAIHVDHCHERSTVRGLLCGPCNTGLGSFREAIDVMRAAAAYLRSR